MKKIYQILLLTILISSFSLQNKNVINENENTLGEVVTAIENSNFNYFIKQFQNNKLKVNQRIEGKTILILASIYDNPEMIRFLIQNGAHFNGECSKGFDAIYYAKIHKSYYALAELIVLKA
tara:strand:+ start:897 stop:1262 length:366 start_codon:yes stop_codon:yes gene_type:complete